MRMKTVHLFMCAVLAAALGTFGSVAKAVPVSLSFDPPIDFEGILNIDVESSCFDTEGLHGCTVSFLDVDFTDIFGNHWTSSEPLMNVEGIDVVVVNGQFFAFAATLTPPFFFLENGDVDLLFASAAANGNCDINPMLIFEIEGRIAKFECDGAVDPGNRGTYQVIGVIPEPGTLALLGLGLAAFAASRRRKLS